MSRRGDTAPAPFNAAFIGEWPAERSVSRRGDSAPAPFIAASISRRKRRYDARIQGLSSHPPQ